MTGDYRGASEDFEAFVLWGRGTRIPKELLAKREAWAKELQAGHNPFDLKTLEALRTEGTN